MNWQAQPIASTALPIRELEHGAPSEFERAAWDSHCSRYFPSGLVAFFTSCITAVSYFFKNPSHPARLSPK